MLYKFRYHAAITFGFLSNIRIIPFGLLRLAIPRGEVNFADELGGQRKLVLPFLDAKRQKTGSPTTFLSVKLNRFFFDRSRVWRWSDAVCSLPGTRELSLF